jgi:hypothetical protein
MCVGVSKAAALRPTMVYAVCKDALWGVCSLIEVVVDAHKPFPHSNRSSECDDTI